MLAYTKPATAASIAFAPVGNVAAANIQAAIAELDLEKAIVGNNSDITGFTREINFALGARMPTRADNSRDTYSATTEFVQKQIELRNQDRDMNSAGEYGWIKWPGGTIMQWGSTVVTTSSTGYATVALNFTYPNLNCAVFAWNGDGQFLGDGIISTYGTPPGGVFPIRCFNSAGAPHPSAPVRVNWWSIGY